MEVESEITRLQAENMALQSIVVGLCLSLPRDLVVNAFDYAETVSEAASTQLGGEDTSEHLAGVADVIEQLRTAAITDTGVPRSGI